MQKDRVSARAALSSTAAYYSATCIVLYKHRCSRLNYRTANMRCFVSHACDQHVHVVDVNWAVIANTKVIDDTEYFSASAPSWTRTTVANGYKFSAVMRLSRRLLDRSETHVLCTQPAFRPPLRMILSEFRRDHLRRKTRVMRYRAALCWRSYV